MEETAAEDLPRFKGMAQFPAACSCRRRIRARPTSSPVPRAAAPPPPPAPEAVIPEIPNDPRIKIDDIDRQRIASLIGDFGDSATLFGNLFAMNESIKDLREKLQRAEDRLMLSQVRKVGGDHSISLNIPERHAQPIKDISDSGGLSVERYMQAKLEEALDNLWFY